MILTICGRVVTPLKLSMGRCLKKRVSWPLTAAILAQTTTLPITAFPYMYLVVTWIVILLLVFRMHGGTASFTKNLGKKYSFMCGMVVTLMGGCFN